MAKRKAVKSTACHFYGPLDHRSPLAPYLCVMAERSEEIEALLVAVEDMVAAFYAVSVVEAVDAAEGKSGEARVKAAGEISKAGRYLKLFRGTGTRAVKAIAALPGRQRDTAPDAEESAMNDDDSRWTPERIAELHAKVRERMDKFVGSLEFKRMASRELAKSDRAVAADPAVQGKPSTPAP
nr:hypothetical protein [Caulobacter sp. FWC2]